MAADATVAAAAGPSSPCRPRGGTGRRDRSRRKPAAAATAAAAVAAESVLLLLLLLVVRSSAQGVLRGAAGATGAAISQGLEREIGGADGAVQDPQAQQGDKGLLSSLFGPHDDAAAAAAAASAAAHNARLLPLGTYLLHWDVEGNFPQRALPASPFPFAGAAGNKATAQLLAAAKGMQSGAAGNAAPSSPSPQQPPQASSHRYYLLDTFIRLIFFDQRSVAESSPSRHPLLPMCGLVAPIVDTPGFCSAVAFVEARGALLGGGPLGGGRRRMVCGSCLDLTCGESINTFIWHTYSDARPCKRSAGKPARGHYLRVRKRAGAERGASNRFTTGPEAID